MSFLTAVGQDFSGIIQAWALSIYFAFAGLRYHSVFSPQTLKPQGRSQHIRQRHWLLPGGAPALTIVCPALPRAKTLQPAAIAATSAFVNKPLEVGFLPPGCRVSILEEGITMWTSHSSRLERKPSRCLHQVMVTTLGVIFSKIVIGTFSVCNSYQKF